jgi:hypothetical protein
MEMAQRQMCHDKYMTTNTISDNDSNELSHLQSGLLKQTSECYLSSYIDEVNVILSNSNGL